MDKRKKRECAKCHDYKCRHWERICVYCQIQINSDKTIENCVKIKENLSKYKMNVQGV